MTKAAGGAGVVSLPVVTDIIHPTLPVKVKIDGREQRQRLVSELLAENLLQDCNAGGTVQYFQDGVLVATVENAANTVAPAALAANKATTAVFQIPVYFAEYWRKDTATAEGLAWPTSFTGGKVLPNLTVEFPIANNGGGAFSGWNVVLWFDYDGLQWPADASGNPRSLIVRQARSTKQYAAVGDLTVPIPQADALMQFSLLLAAGNPGPGYHILPTLDKSLRDKMILLHCVQAAGLPSTNEERAAWAKRIALELPAFAHFLMKFRPDGKVDPRTGCVNFWHPMIANALMELQPEMRLLEMIDNLNLIGDDAPLWEGTASEFEQAMRSLDKDEDGKKSGMMDRMFYNGQRAGAMLTELAEQTRRVIKTNRGNTSHYRIYRTEQN